MVKFPSGWAKAGTATTSESPRAASNASEVDAVRPVELLLGSCQVIRLRSLARVTGCRIGIAEPDHEIGERVDVDRRAVSVDRGGILAASCLHTRQPGECVGIPQLIEERPAIGCFGLRQPPA